MRARTILFLVLALAAVLGGLAWFVLRGSGVATDPVRPLPGSTSPVATGPGATPLEGASGATGRGEVEVVPPASGAEGAKPPSARAEAELAVRVLLAPERRPLPGVRLVLETDGAFAFDAGRRVDGSRAGPGESPVTDADGRAWFGVPARQGLRLRVSALRGTSRPEVRELDGLRPGETRAVEVVVTPEAALAFHGRVVGPSGEPVAGAAVRTADQRRFVAPGAAVQDDTVPPRDRAGGPGGVRGNVLPTTQVTTDADGRFEVVLASWQGRVAEVVAPGFVPATFTLDEEAADPERPFTVRLRRSASLEVFVTDATGRGLAKLAVRIGAEPVALLAPGTRPAATTTVEASWTARTDRDGRAEFVDLPTDTPLVVEVLEDGKLVLRERTPLTLAAGSYRRVDLVLSGTSLVHGVLRDELGSALANSEVWIAPAHGTHATLFNTHHKPFGRTVTDKDGRFRFKEIPVGAWAVGPSPRPTHAEQPATERLAPVGRTVDVFPGVPEVEVVLDAERGLVLEGRVLGPEGEPAAGCPVHARHAGLDLDVVIETDKRGAFALGPLPSGTWTLAAVPLVGDAFLPSETLSAQAGTSGLELELARGVELAGRLVDGAGNVVRRAELVLAELDGERGWQSAATADGSFLFRGVAPGRYALCATSDDGGLAGLAGTYDELVVDDEDVTGFELRLAPAARIHVAFEGAETLWFCRVERDGRTVGYAVRNAKASAELVVPPGELTITLRVELEEREETRAVTAVVGERAEVSFR